MEQMLLHLCLDHLVQHICHLVHFTARQEARKVLTEKQLSTLKDLTCPVYGMPRDPKGSTGSGHGHMGGRMAQ